MRICCNNSLGIPGEGALNGAETEETALPHTVHMISMNNNINVYIVGTAHFSKESNEEVRKVCSFYS